ncbi:MAG: hypothetical protein H6916_12895 [Novosphingobium sp.]|uniref:hypothetical protein n=1 Tax=Novosphingobium sp. TaxID=1874826 RepID=UPI001D6F44E0|nr:hypothetical protein [Novosphingobium sp.]MCB2057166.1 hypothetical protein [Novosphingobium sp.]MCP5387693.1 hypothetical protein [Novosphingobium sp.]
MRWFSKTTKKLDRLGIWAGAYTMLSGVLSWVWSQVSAFGEMNWPEAILLGLACGLFLMLGITSSLALWRKFRPLLQLHQDVTSDVEPTQEGVCLYAGWPTLSANDLDDCNRLELAIFCFNGNPYPIKVSKVSGQPRYSGIVKDQPNIEGSALPTPVLLSDRGPAICEPKSEFLLVMHQYLTKREASEIARIMSVGKITLDIRNLEIEMERADCAATKFILPITRSPNLALAKGGEEIKNTTVYASVNVAIGVATSTQDSA